MNFAIFTILRFNLTFQGLSTTIKRIPECPAYFGLVWKSLRYYTRINRQIYAFKALKHFVSFFHWISLCSTGSHFCIVFYRSNKLVALPEAIGGCVKLETLNAMNNVITAVPMCYANLKNLKTINLSNNQIVEFPAMFAGLTHLDMLDLSRNKITSIPAAAKDLYCTELNLNQNQISSIAEELAECQKLKTLRLEENCLQITSIPTKLLSNSVISNITIDGNLFNNKQFTELEGYKAYEERFTAVKKKMF